MSAALPTLPTAPPYRAYPGVVRYYVVGPFHRGKDLLIGTVARIETGDEAQDAAIAARIAAALNYVEGIDTAQLESVRSRRPA